MNCRNSVSFSKKNSQKVESSVTPVGVFLQLVGWQGGRILQDNLVILTEFIM